MYVPRRLIKLVKDRSPLSIEEIRACAAKGGVQLISRSTDPPGPELEQLVFEEDTVLLEGRPLTEEKPFFAALLNKPRATISTAKDPRGKGDLSRWMREMPSGVFPVGRLDRDTTGLLLFTNNGDLANAVLRPEHHTEKLYWLWLNESFHASHPLFTALTRQDDVRYDGASAARLLARSPHQLELELVLHQGKHRQIRRMCRALDLRLLHLHRKRIGPLSDRALAVGQWRRLNATESDALWGATGGKETLLQRKLAGLERQAQRYRSAGHPHPRLEQWLTQNVHRVAASPEIEI